MGVGGLGINAVCCIIGLHRRYLGWDNDDDDGRQGGRRRRWPQVSTGVGMLVGPLVTSFVVVA